MSSTHVSLHYHIVFSTKNRFPFIESAWCERLHEYLGGTVRGLGGVPLQIGGVADHVRLLIGLKAIHAVADIVREIKKASNNWAQASFAPKFQWQEGYGAFTVSRGNVAGVTKYIIGQEEHHRTRTFQEEYVAFLDELGIEYDPRYLW
jgi:REP element-mobilizing transposase RayT